MFALFVCSVCCGRAGVCKCVCLCSSVCVCRSIYVMYSRLCRHNNVACTSRRTNEGYFNVQSKHIQHTEREIPTSLHLICLRWNDEIQHMVVSFMPSQLVPHTLSPCSTYTPNVSLQQINIFGTSKLKTFNQKFLYNKLDCWRRNFK